MAGVTIGKLAAAAGVSVETVRFYQRRGLLPEPERPGPGFREYSGADQWRLAFILRAKELGFTLAEIGDLLGPDDARSTADVIAAAGTKLAALDQQARELARRQDRLRRLVRVCEQGHGGDCLALDLDGADRSRRRGPGADAAVGSVMS